MESEQLRGLIQWHEAYRQEWDSAPGEYVEGGIVGWGKTRRLGMLRLGRVKAYLGVQHVDPGRAGWNIVDAPQARFFLSLFLEGRVVTLRTFPTMDAVLDTLQSFTRQAGL